ncbi:MAG: hypothetical protein DMG40_20920 [Acidobacteria bacterium]|nr:MAG: hypothetical protein DMG40_20920 [Acidobacteriota bacterium]
MNFGSTKKISAGTIVIAFFLLAFFVFTKPAQAQLAGASLSGVVSDESGGAVASAKVSIKNVATGDVREVTTNTDGVYSAPNLSPGNYEVTVTANGFQTTVQKGITLTVGAQQALNFGLKVGQLTQTITVNEAPPSVDTTSSTVTATVEQRTVVELPLNGRDWTQLATLQPGVISVRAQASTGATANRGNRGFGDQLADSGHRPNENTYRIDGININDYSNGAPGSVLGASLGVDAVQEFSVVTTNYTAAYGRTSGAVINAITRSGSNQFHGSGYFFDRDKVLDARNFFDGPKIPPFRRTQFGGSAGGPIIKDKTFIFGDYEAVRQSQSLSFSDIIPSAAARAGNLCSAPGAGATCTPHTVTVDSRVAPYLGLWPDPTKVTAIATQNNGDTETIRTAGLKVLNENYFTIKADHKISASDSLNGSYFFDKAPQATPDNLNNNIHQVFTKRQMFGIAENHIFNPALVNTARFGFNRVVGLVNQPVRAVNPVAGDTNLGISAGLFAPLIEVSGEISSAGGLGNLSFFGHHYNSFQAYDDIFWTKGKHSLKFGFAFERMQYDVLSKVRQNGDFRFNATSVTPLENFLTNHPAQALLLSPAVRGEVGTRDSLFGGYIQNDWRLRSNLTLNIGLRYEILTDPSEAHGKFGLLNSFSAPAGSGPCPNVFPNAFGPTSVPGCTVPVGSMWESNPTTHNFDPRIGFSWDPFHNGKTALRGGFGLFDVLPLPYVFTIGDSLTYPFSLSFSQRGLPAGSFPNVLPFINPTAPGTRWVDQHPHRSYAMNWNVNIQRQLTSKVSAQIGYVGSHVVHNAFTTDDSNQVIAKLINGQYFWPIPVGSGTIANPNSAFIRPIFFDGTSKYNGLQAQLAARDLHGFQAQTAYTWSKCLSDGDGAQLGDPYQNSLSSLIFFDKAGSRHGPCDFDIRQNLSVNYLYSLPSPGGDSPLKWVAGGWQVGGIITASTGVPFTVVTGADPLGQNSSDQFDYPDRVAGCNPINSNFKSIVGLTYLNASCFQLAPPTANGIRMGNNGRNQLYGPKLVDVDFSVIKNTHVPRISEAFNVQLRFEFFNLFNHANFQAPLDNNTLGGSLGQIDATTTTSRQIQLGVKFLW